MLRSRLERKGFEIHIERDGLEGLNAVPTIAPDIILLDVSLPSMSGYEVAKKIKADTKVSHIPIIMLTAHALTDDAKKAFEAGADEYEPKPVNFAVLLQKIETLTGHTKS